MFIPIILNDIATEEAFESTMPAIIGLEEFEEIKPNDHQLMKTYITDRIFGYTPEEVDIILEGDFMMDISED